jgi:lipid II:glycine glycyltransferase (peptidoglycan interpeptide bridge formation enzyme)
VGIVKIQRTKGELPIQEIEAILKKYHVMWCKIEPSFALSVSLRVSEGQALKQNGYRLSGWPLLGTKTLRVDLRPSEEEIFNSFKKDCRYVLKKIQDSRFKIQENNYDNFYQIWKQSAKRKNLWIPKEKEYKNLVEAFGNSVLCLTTEGLAGALILVHKKTAFYYYAGSTAEGTRLNLPYLIVWEAMKKAKKTGCQVWDFEGIYDSRWPNKGWAGFSHFKKSFGGKEVEFLGSYEKWRLPF